MLKKQIDNNCHNLKFGQEDKSVRIVNNELCFILFYFILDLGLGFSMTL